MLIALDTETLDELLADELMLNRVKLEGVLLPYMGLRPISQITVPAEFPGGFEMGKSIDRALKPQIDMLQAVKEPRAKVQAIQETRKLMETQFEAVVENSDPYKAYYSWSDRLGLKSEQAQVRPTIHEIFLYKEGRDGKELKRLIKDREKIRVRVQRRPNPGIGRVRFAYPEEFDAKWITRMGRLLGYPDCCIKQYAQDRAKGVNVETRAATQLAEAIEEEKKVDTHAYILGFFFPCRPGCPNSTEKGYRWQEAFSKMDERLGKMYTELLGVNANMVLRQPELINSFLSQFKEPAREKDGADG
jgi:hypothetical protein